MSPLVSQLGAPVGSCGFASVLSSSGFVFVVSVSPIILIICVTFHCLIIDCSAHAGRPNWQLGNCILYHYGDHYGQSRPEIF